MQSSLLTNPRLYTRTAGVARRPSEKQRVLSDEDLLRLCAHGDEAALQELVQRHQASIFRFAYRLLASVEDAEDVALEVFVRVWKYAGRFQFRASVATWLYRIAANLARDMHHRNQNRLQAPWSAACEQTACASGNVEEEALHRMECKEQADDLYRALQRLNDGDRLLLVLYYVEERDYATIQEIVGVSYMVLKTRMARARRRLQALLEESDRLRVL